MTRKTSHSRLLVPLLLLVVGALGGAQVAAGAWFSVGGSFTVGGLRFNVGVHDHDPVGAGRYYRIDRPLYVAGARCSDRCYVRGGYHYHHESCPAVRAYFARFSYVPAPAVPYGYYVAPHYFAPRVVPRYRYVAPQPHVGRPYWRVAPSPHGGNAFSDRRRHGRDDHHRHNDRHGSDRHDWRSHDRHH